MLSSFRSIQPYFKVKPNSISIDNLIFKLHYRWTFLILICCTILVTSRQYIGEHIKCIEGSGKLNNVIDTFCFFTSTFTVVKHLNASVVIGGHVLHAGVGPYNPETDPIIRHAYYQWVPFILFGQALAFYFPHLLWKSWEGNIIKNLTDGFQMTKVSQYIKKTMKIGNTEYLSKDRTDSRIADIKLTFYNRLKLNIFWGPKLILCETLNFINVCLQIYLTNKFLAGQFYTLGLNILNEKWNPRYTSLDIIFPKVTKCYFYKSGQGGSIQMHDTLCIMALNIINEKIYTFLWFWFIILFVLSLLALIWRFITVLLHKRKKFNELIFAYANPGRLNRQEIHVITTKISFTDWMFLYFLASNLPPYIFRYLLKQLVDEADNLNSKKYLENGPISSSSNSSNNDLTKNSIEENYRLTEKLLKSTDSLDKNELTLFDKV